ncbi:GntR family transcriptional regulator [Halomonas sp. M4R1S46]|uniref:GntR family transcriptional regulator n=1 Tax=Halomonas sp. M4R1S46 TaxID=2982692 RepID=UPI0021E3DCCB|nr:GntR family transcriptional regulator [Halomonas sp. M4R1S46]UYG07010.1 GntR family transcriptional regulator [Halomonas sp. M4R1S46]
MDDTTDLATRQDTPPQPRLRRLSLYEVVAERLREMVLEGELPPGSRISEKRLCETFEVSRTPLREALKVLANEGLVELLPNRGAKVTEVEPGEVADLFEVMVELEGLSGRLLASRAGEAEVAEIRELHQRMMSHYRRQERPEYFALNQQLHRRLTEIAGNAVLLELETSLTVKVTRARYAANLQLGRWEESAREHGEILAALEARDGEALSCAMRKHMRRTGDAVIQGLGGG